MDVVEAVAVLSALAQPTRLRVVETLGGVFPSGLPVGDIAKRADTPPNTMSAHLAILSRAGLVSANRRGRIVEYVADPGALAALADLVRGLAPIPTHRA